MSNDVNPIANHSYNFLNSKVTVMGLPPIAVLFFFVACIVLVLIHYSLILLIVLAIYPLKKLRKITKEGGSDVMESKLYGLTQKKDFVDETGFFEKLRF